MLPLDAFSKIKLPENPGPILLGLHVMFKLLSIAFVKLQSPVLSQVKGMGF